MSVHVEALDHVNIITSDLEGSARFYARATRPWSRAMGRRR